MLIYNFAKTMKSKTKNNQSLKKTSKETLENTRCREGYIAKTRKLRRSKYPFIDIHQFI